MARWVPIFLLGLGVGYGLASYRDALDAQVPAAGQQQPPAPVQSHRPTEKVQPGSQVSAPAIGNAIVEVRLFSESDGKTRRVPGIVVAPNNRVIVPLSVMHQAQAGAVIDAAGDEYPLKAVIGADFSSGLALLESQKPMAKALMLTPAEDALYLGREFIALGANGQTTGWIDRPAGQRTNGLVTYQARIQDPLAWENGALIDPQTQALIGIAVNVAKDSAVYEAIDASTVADLLSAAFPGRPQTLMAFAKELQKSPEAKILQIRSLAEARKWNEVIPLAIDLAQQDMTYQERAAPYLDKAYGALIRAAMDQGAIAKARDLLVQARERLGDNGPRLFLQAELDRMTGNLRAARSNLYRLIALDPLLADQVYPVIRQLVARLTEGKGGPLSMDEKIGLLTEEVVSDPDYAAHYAMLGRLYFEQGRYDEAITHLTYAMQLDAKLASGLSSLIDAARQRLNTPDLVVVPIEAHGHTLYVDLKINNAKEPFRFILDTGASFTAISLRVARQLGLSVSDDLPWIELNTAKGMTQAPVVTLRSVDLGGARVENIQAVILTELDGSGGLLGLSYLNHFNFEFNQDERKLLLTPR